MLAFGAIADRFGRRRIMLIGLVLLGAGEPGDRLRHHRGAADRRPGGDGRRGRDDDARIDGAGLPAVRRRRPARPGDHPDLDRGSGRARDRPDRRRLRARDRALAGPAAGERADRRARDHRRAARHRRGRRRPTCTAIRSTSPARCWARRRSCSRSSRRRCSSTRAPVRGRRGRPRRRPSSAAVAVRPPRAFGALPAARPQARRPSRWSPAAWRSRPRPGWRPPASATW